MADDRSLVAEFEDEVLSNPAWTYVARGLMWLVMAAVTIIMLAMLGLAALNTDRGRVWLAEQAFRIQPDSGLRVSLGAIDGSLFDTFTLHDLRLSDPAGMFFEAPSVSVDWRPQAGFRRRLHVNNLDVPAATLHRLPQLLPTPDTDEPILPGYDIYVGRFRVGQLRLGAAVAGKPHVLRAVGGANIHDRRLLTVIEASSPSGGDVLVARIDAAPDANRFELEARVLGPQGGVIAGLLKTDKPLSLQIAGTGSWRVWTGKISGTLGDDELADLKLSASRGSFRATGRVHPGRAVGGMLARLEDTGFDLDARATIDNRQIDADVALASPAVEIAGRGGVDLGENSYKSLSVFALIRKPEAVIRTMTAGNMSLRLMLDGQMASPAVDYRLSADWLAIGNTRLDAFEAIGKGGMPRGDVAFPITARTRRVTGVGEFVEELATNVELAGTMAVSNLMLVGKDMRFKSDRLAARADLRVDLRTGAYNVDARGKLPDYAIPGLGLVDVDANLNFRPDTANRRQLRLTGQAAANIKRLDNDFLAWLFDGRPTITARIDRDPGGTIVIDNARLTSPDMQLSGRGRYMLGQQIVIAARGTSQRFGPLEAELSGLISRPAATVRLDSYRAGIELTGVTARFSPGPDAFAFTASAGSAVGPVAASGRIVTLPGRTTFDIDRLELAGLLARGQLLPSGKGASAVGVLDVDGRGISGTVGLTDENGRQRFDVELAARTGALDLGTPATIRRGEAKSVIVLTDGGYDIFGSFSLEGVRQGSLLLRSAKGTLELQNGEGSAVAVIAGERGVPFSLDMAAQIDPGRWSITSRGTIDRRPFRLAAPAQLIAVPGGWRLAPVTLKLPEGSAELSGTFAPAGSLVARLDRAGLELFELVVPGLGFTGTASGTVDMGLSAGGFPMGSAKLRVRDFTRAGEAVAEPVDMTVLARIGETNAALRAAFDRNGQSYGQFQARLPAIPGSRDAPWLERLSAAPLSAQLRWRGPAEMLWPLAGVSAISMTGNIAMAVDMNGTVGDPQLTGSLRARGAQLESAITGTRVANINLASRFRGSRLELERFSGVVGKGTATGSGHVDLSLARGFPIDLDVILDNAEILNRDDLRATASGPLKIVNSPEGARISGDLEINRARFQIGRATAADIPSVKVRQKHEDLQRMATLAESAPTIWQLDVKANAQNRVEVRGMGLDSEWRAELDIGGSASRPKLTGRATLVRGEYDFAGRRFELKRGGFRFRGDYPPDPTIDIAAEARVEGLTATIAILGTAAKPEISFASVPALPQDEVLSRVLFGTSVSNLSAPEALQLAGAVASLRGGGGGLNPIGAVQKAVGLDRLRILQANSETGRGTAIAAGEYITNRVYVEVASDAQGYTATNLEVQLTRSLSILSQLATLGGNSINLRWSKDY